VCVYGSNVRVEDRPEAVAVDAESTTAGAFER
jgi:hypothetical protein